MIQSWISNARYVFSAQLVLNKYVLYTKVVMLLVSIYALKFHLHISVFGCRREKQPSCMQYKEEGTRRWSKNSAQQEQMCPLKTRWGNVYTQNFSMHVYGWTINGLHHPLCRMLSEHTRHACYWVRALIKWLLALLDSSIWSDFFIQLFFNA